MKLGFLKKVLGIIRKILNKGHDLGYIPSEKPTIPVKDTRFPDV